LRVRERVGTLSWCWRAVRVLAPRRSISPRRIDRTCLQTYPRKWVLSRSKACMVPPFMENLV